MAKSIFRNANGNNYHILAMKNGSGFLAKELNRVVREQYPYVVARRFDPNIPSWTGGNYFETYREALEFFEKITK